MSIKEAGAYNCATEKTMRFAFLPAALLLSCSILGSGFPRLPKIEAITIASSTTEQDAEPRGETMVEADHHDHHYDNRDQGGIGPGKGASDRGSSRGGAGRGVRRWGQGFFDYRRCRRGYWRNHRPVCAGQSRPQQLLPPLGRISMTNRYAVVLWVASLMPCVAIGQQASPPANLRPM